MFKELEPQLVELTLDFAKSFSEMPCLKGDRDRESAAGKGRCRMLENELKSKAFHTPSWVVAELNGVKYRLNGGHSSKMLAECNGNFPAGMKVLLMHFVCENEEDLVELFMRFDRRGSVRTVKDIIKAAARVHDPLEEVSISNVNKAVSGIAYSFIEDGEKGSMTVESKQRLVKNNIDFILWSNHFVNSRFSTVPVIASMYRTWIRDKKDATAFWTYVRDESHPDNQHPSRKLATFIRDAHGNRKISKRETLVRCLHAWNAYRNDAPTRLRYSEECGIPKVV